MGKVQDSLVGTSPFLTKRTRERGHWAPAHHVTLSTFRPAPCPPQPKGAWRLQRAAHLVAAGHDDVLGLRHDDALLGHQRVLGVAGQTVGGEESVVLLHAEGLPRQLAGGTVCGEGVAGEAEDRQP